VSKGEVILVERPIFFQVCSRGLVSNQVVLRKEAAQVRTFTFTRTG